MRFWRTCEESSRFELTWLKWTHYQANKTTHIMHHGVCDYSCLMHCKGPCTEPPTSTPTSSDCTPADTSRYHLFLYKFVQIVRVQCILVSFFYIQVNSLRMNFNPFIEWMVNFLMGSCLSQRCICTYICNFKLLLSEWDSCAWTSECRFFKWRLS